MSSFGCMLRPTWMLISALQHKSKYKSNSISNFFEKKKIGLPCCSTREDLSIDVSITNVGLILTKLRWFLFSGYGQTDTVLESSHGNMSAHKKFQLKAQNYELAIDPCIHGWRGCIIKRKYIIATMSKYSTKNIFKSNLVKQNNFN